MPKDSLCLGLLISLCCLAACASPQISKPGSLSKDSLAAASSDTGLAVLAQLDQLLQEQFESSLPGPQLEALQPLQGDWQVTMSLLAWPTGEVSLPAVVATGKTYIRSTLGERFLQWETLLDWSGTQIASSALLGFDKQSERYQLWRASELGSGQAIFAGSGDPARGGLYLERTQSADGQVSRLRCVLRLDGADQFELEEFGYDAERSEWVAVRMTRYLRLGVCATDSGPRDTEHRAQVKE